MTTTTTSEPAVAVRTTLPASAIFVDTLTMAKRNLRRLMRTPQLVVFSTIQPVMFVLLFRYVFGGSIKIPGFRYVDYLVPGIIVQTALFSGATAAISMADDANSGMFDRLRSLPMARSAVLAGRTMADSVRALFVIALMLIVGSLVGFRFHNGFVNGLAAVALCWLFASTFLWFFSFIGLTVRDTETAQIASFLPIFPFVFASSIFTQISTMPGWMQAIARNQPVTFVANAVRMLTQGQRAALILPESTASYVIKALIWMAGITILFAPLAVRRYRRG